LIPIAMGLQQHLFAHMATRCPEINHHIERSPIQVPAPSASSPAALLTQGGCGA
jgi:hypothetical protein